MWRVHFKITERLQDLGTYIHQDVELRLRDSCDSPRLDMGDQLGGLKDVQKITAQVIGNLPIALDTRLVQNEQRNHAQEGLLGKLCATLGNLNTKLDNNIQETQQMNRKYIAAKQRMEEMSQEVKVEVGESIDSAANRFEARL